jgi:hypothetical protein
MSPKSTRPPHRKSDRTPLGLWLWRHAEEVGLGSYSKLAAKTGMPISTLHMISTDKREISPRTWQKLAPVIRPPDRSPREFTEEFLIEAKYADRAAYLRTESRAERLLASGRVTAVAMTSEPFVRAPSPAGGQWAAGFAVRLFTELAHVMGIWDVRWERGRLSELGHVFRGPGNDVAVSAVLPTFRKSRLVAFSKPFPFLRIALSAVVRRQAHQRTDVTIRELLNWDEAVSSREGADLGSIKFAFAKGGAADDFVASFSPEIATQAETLPEPTVSDFVQLLKKDVDIVIADAATCQAILEHGDDVIALPKHKDDLSGDFLRWNPDSAPEPPERRLEFLARYPIVFALPLGDDEWRKTVDEAMEYLLTERIRPILALYKEYLRYPAFKAAFYPRDTNYPALEVQTAFSQLVHPPGAQPPRPRAGRSTNRAR